MIEYIRMGLDRIVYSLGCVLSLRGRSTYIPTDIHKEKQKPCVIHTENTCVSEDINSECQRFQFSAVVYYPYCILGIS